MNKLAYICPLCKGPADCPVGHMYICQTAGCRNGPAGGASSEDLDGAYFKGKLETALGVRPAGGTTPLWCYVLRYNSFSTVVVEDRNTKSVQKPDPASDSFLFDSPIHGYSLYGQRGTVRDSQPQTPLMLTSLFWIHAFYSVEVFHCHRLIVMYHRVP